MESGSFWGSDARHRITLEHAAWVLAVGHAPPHGGRFTPEPVLYAMAWIMERVPQPAHGWRSVPVRVGAILSNVDTVLMQHLLEALLRERSAFAGAAALLDAWEAVPREVKYGQLFSLWQSHTLADPRSFDRPGLHQELCEFSPLFPRGLKSFSTWAGTVPGLEATLGRPRTKPRK